MYCVGVHVVNSQSIAREMSVDTVKSASFKKTDGDTRTCAFVGAGVSVAVLLCVHASMHVQVCYFDKTSILYLNKRTAGECRVVRDKCVH